MSAELEMPLDELTGMPFPLAPPDEQLPRDDPSIANLHHWWFPKTAEELQTLGGRALRNSYIQLVAVGDHNWGSETVHAYYRGPQLPEADDVDTQFKLCVLGAAGYCADRVIDLHAPGGPTDRPITQTEREFFNKRAEPSPVEERDVVWYRRKFAEERGGSEELSDGEIRARLEAAFALQSHFARHNFHYGYGPLREFFEAHLISAPMLDVRPRLVKRFLGAKDEEQQWMLGDTILTRASVVSTAGIVRLYRQLHQAGALHPFMPPAPIELVKDKLGNERRRRRLMPKLARCLEGMVENESQAA